MLLALTIGNSRHRFLAATMTVGALLALTACAGTKAAPPAPSAVPVLAATVEQRDVPQQVKAIGNVEPYSTVSIKTQITGELTAVFFKEGEEVKKGQLLFELDKRPFEAALKQAEGMLAKDEAQAANARLQARRYAELNKAGVVSKEENDQMQSNADALDASVTADKAAVQNARVQLIYCSIYSPINGRTGTLVLHRGNMIKANDNPALVTINQVEPIYVTFTVPEQYLAEIKRYAGSRKLRVQAVIPDDSRGPIDGRLSFIDNSVDQTTGTIKLKGEFPNTDRRLWPGQFVNAVLTLREQPNAIVVPSQAVQNGQQGQFVFVIKDDMTVEARPVAIVQSTDGLAVVQKGLAAGERVVTDGQLRLAPGAKVQIKPAVVPQAPQSSGLRGGYFPARQPVSTDGASPGAKAGQLKEDRS
jgi:membrane fusion protein, multidrug efflux system